MENVGSKSKLPANVDTALQEFDELATAMKRAINMATEQSSPKN